MNVARVIGAYRSGARCALLVRDRPGSKSLIEFTTPPRHLPLSHRVPGLRRVQAVRFDLSGPRPRAAVIGVTHRRQAEFPIDIGSALALTEAGLPGSVIYEPGIGSCSTLDPETAATT